MPFLGNETIIQLEVAEVGSMRGRKGQDWTSAHECLRFSPLPRIPFPLSS